MSHSYNVSFWFSFRMNRNSAPNSHYSQNSRPDSNRYSQNSRPDSNRGYSDPNRYSQNSRPDSNRGLSDSRYSQYSRPDSNRGLSHNSIDLDVSRLSHSGSVSSVSTVTLGGCHYPVGSTVGTSGLFVIGDPSAGSKSRSRSPHSTGTSPSIRHLIISRGYDFEDWNWPVIRFSLLVLLIAVMIGLLAATITLTIRAQNSCITQYEWWQGAVIYRIPVLEFFDGTGHDGAGDFSGIEQKVDYIKDLDVSVVSLAYALPTINRYWDEPSSFNLTGSLAPQGSWDDFRSMVSTLHRWDIQVLLELNASYTATDHPWFLESMGQDSNVGNKYRNFYIWQSEIPVRLWIEWGAL